MIKEKFETNCFDVLELLQIKKNLLKEALPKQYHRFNNKMEYNPWYTFPSNNFHQLSIYLIFQFR